MGGTEDELVKIAKKLEKISHRKESSVRPTQTYKLTFDPVSILQSSAQALDLLKLLAKMPITLELIQRTRIGLIVNNLRKAITDDDVGTLSKTLIKNWKKLLDTKDSAKSETNGSSEAKNGNSSTPMVVDGTASSESSQGKRFRVTLNRVLLFTKLSNYNYRRFCQLQACQWDIIESRGKVHGPSQVYLFISNLEASPQCDLSGIFS